MAGGATAALATLGLARIHSRGSQPAADLASAARYVVTDRRLPESLRFAEGVVAQGGAALDVVDGLTRLWSEFLLPMWSAREPGTVAGLTTHDVWDCLAEQARSHSRHSCPIETALPLSLRRGTTNSSLIAWRIA